jgi:peptidoglycan hydrolase-like protein with peptidoglycan-binding domain
MVEAVAEPRAWRRVRLGLTAARAVVVASAMGLIAATYIKPPTPSPGVLTAPVMRQVLAKTVVIRGTVVTGEAIAVTPASAQGATRLVVTRLFKQPGEQVWPGDVVIEVSGRPLIALPGTSPAYRDLRPGDHGQDVAQLQAALRSLGYPGGDPSATFGPGTKAAITQLYRRLGYAVPTTGGLDDVDDLPALQAAAQAVTDAQRSVDMDARRVADAQAALAAAQSASPRVPSEVVQATRALAAAETRLGDTAQKLASAQRAQRLLIAATGAEMPLSEFVFLPTFPAVLDSVNGHVGSTVSAPLLTIDTGPIVVSAVVGHGDVHIVKAGQNVTLAAEQIGRQARGLLAAVGPYRPAVQNPSSLDTPLPAGHLITVTPTPALSATWLGLNVRVTITVASTPGRVLVVPMAALTDTQDGSASVVVVTPDGAQSAVPVIAGLDAGGLVEVTPAAGARLQPGDRVVIA